MNQTGRAELRLTGGDKGGGEEEFALQYHPDKNKAEDATEK